MNRSLFFLLLAICTCSAWADDSALKTGIFQIPPSYFGKLSDSGALDPLPKGVRLLEHSPFYSYSPVYDVRDVFASMGISPSKDSEALFLPQRSLLYVRDTKSNLELMETLGLSSDYGMAFLLKNVISVVRFTSEEKLNDLPTPTVEQLRRIAGTSWQQIAEYQVVSRSGQTVTASSTSEATKEVEKAEKIRAPEIASGDSGGSISIESILGPDNFSIDSTISFRFRTPKTEKHKGRLLTFDTTSSFWDSQPQILLYSSGEAGEPSYVVIMHVTILLPNSFRLTTPDNGRK